MNRFKRVLALILALILVFCGGITIIAETVDDPAMGDINADGKVNISDCILVKRNILNTYSLSNEQFIRADINKSNSVNIGDYILIKRMILGTYTAPDIPPVSDESSDTVPPVSDESSTPESTVPEVKWDGDGALKVLSIGNSFSIDTLQYVYNIAVNIGVEKVVVGNLYIPGCSVDTHTENILNDAEAYEFYYNSNGSWVQTLNTKISTAVAKENWDYITLQQVSGSSGMADSLGNLPTLISEVRKLCSENTQILWNMTWAYEQGSWHWDYGNYNKDQMTMYNAIVSTAQSKILTNDNFAGVIPVGTAIQNARTSFVGDALTRDTYHLSLNYGRYLAGVAFVRYITGMSVDGLTYTPDSVANSIFAEDYIAVAIESANNAYNTPYQVTPSDITTPNGYTKLDFGVHASGFYNSSMDKLIHTDDSLSAYYYATDIFTKAELPVGSVIIVREDWKYRLEGWEYNGTRPNEVSSETVVTEEWWGSYTARAFNLSRSDNTILTNYGTATANSLSIFIPNDFYADYKTIELGVTTFGFYNSCIDKLIHTDDGLKDYYCATKIFTKEDIPAGSVIVIEDGWQYRPEGWDYTGARPDNVSTKTVLVTEEWWGDYTERAFNISKTSGESLVNNVEAALNALTIYIP